MNIEWAELFILDVPFLEIFVRGTIVYLALILMMRFGKNRGIGSIGVSDMLVVILIADASQNAMAGEYTSITAGLLLVATILFWDFAIDGMCYYIPALEKIIERKTICLIKNGKMLKRNMRHEFITQDELMAQLRSCGIDDVKLVKDARIEENGDFSAVRIKD